MNTANPQSSLHPSIFVFRIGQVRAFLEDWPNHSFDGFFDPKNIGNMYWREIPDALNNLKTAVVELQVQAEEPSAKKALLELHSEIEKSESRTQDYWLPPPVFEPEKTHKVSDRLPKRSRRESERISAITWERIYDLLNFIDDLRNDFGYLIDEDNRSENSSQTIYELDTSHIPTQEELDEKITQVHQQSVQHLEPLFAKIDQLVERIREKYQCFYQLGMHLKKETFQRAREAPDANRQFSKAMKSPISLKQLIERCLIEVPGLRPILLPPPDAFSTSTELQDFSYQVAEILAQAPIRPLEPRLPQLHPYTMTLPKARNSDWGKHVKKFHPTVYERHILGLKEREIEYLAYILYHDETVVTYDMISKFFRGKYKKNTIQHYISDAISKIESAIRDAFSIPNTFPLGKPSGNGKKREIRIDIKLLSDRVKEILKEENSPNFPEIIVFKSHDDERT